ncbi:MAG TPA: CopG family transcriptional regulator [Thermoanaerobaculia bacterium]|nr:CopG family transcriptional regulator [Thermoanaerobaculia bacterium]
MGQVTLYLDAEAEARMKEAAKASGVSLSRWLADLIREKTATEWPASIAALAGAWSDFPTAEEIRATKGEDVPRERI